jgi:ABC-type transporter Mla MlaB component
MLRITLVREAELSTLKVEGRLSGPWVAELEHSWNEFLKEGMAPSVQVDLSEVTSVSSEGKQLLRRMWEQGAKLQSRSLMTQFILNQIRKEMKEKPSGGEGGRDGFGHRAENPGTVRGVHRQI